MPQISFSKKKKVDEDPVRKREGAYVRRWTRLDYLAGDFTERVDRAFLREDVMDPGDIAPFWERFGLRHFLGARTLRDTPDNTYDLGRTDIRGEDGERERECFASRERERERGLFLP